MGYSGKDLMYFLTERVAGSRLMRLLGEGM